MSGEIDQLTGHEGGKWRVHTDSGSHYDFDLDAMTVTRFRGPTAGPTVNDGTRPIRAIEQCRVGEAGRWTMRSGGGYLDPDFYWQVTSIIRRIERLDGDPDAE
jgi:hypothetical protein